MCMLLTWNLISIYKGAMSDHIESIKKGFLVLLPVLDEKGRAIIYGEPNLAAEGEVDKVCVFVCGVFKVFLHIYSFHIINSCRNINRSY